jgi:hypothetical protein
MSARRFVTADDLMAYEDGSMSEEEVVDLFQRLVDNGMAWSLQGHYGRTAEALIAAGRVHLVASHEHWPGQKHCDWPGCELNH